MPSSHSPGAEHSLPIWIALEIPRASPLELNQAPPESPWRMVCVAMKPLTYRSFVGSLG